MSRAPAVGDRFVCLEDLFALMGRHGVKIYRSATVTALSGPDGIVAAGEVVVIKINYQWPERGGTNTDLLRGLVRALVDHPDSFSGEIVVAENARAEARAFEERHLPPGRPQTPASVRRNAAPALELLAVHERVGLLQG